MRSGESCDAFLHPRYITSTTIIYTPYTVTTLPPPVLNNPKSQRRRLRILHALIDAHEPLPRRFRQRDELRQILHRGRVRIMHDDQVASAGKVTLKRIQLLLGRGGEGPEVILDVDAPVDEARARNEGGETLADAGAFGAEGRAEVFAWVDDWSEGIHLRLRG